MASKKVSDFNPVTGIEDTDLIPIIRTSEADPALKNSYITGDNFKTAINYTRVANYSALPTPSSDYLGQIYLVENAQGVYFINRKEAGLWIAEVSDWRWLGQTEAYFSDANFTLFNSSNNTKKVVVSLSAISPSTTRTHTYPDTNIDFGDIALNTAKRHDPVTVTDSSELDFTLTGQDITATLKNNSIANARLSHVATSTIKGRSTAGTGAVEDLTGTQVKSILSISTSDVSGLGTMATQNASSVAITGGTAVLNNTGLSIKDTDSSHNLNITTGSNLTANRSLTINTGDSARTVTLSGDTTLSGTNSGDQTITLTGDVTGSGTGSFAATIANNAVTLGKMATVATDSILGRATASTGNVEVLTALPFAYTGDVTRPADSNVTTIANNAVTNAKSAQMAANTVKSNATAGTADPSDLAVGANTVVGRVAGNIVAAQLVNAQIATNTIANDKIAQMAANTVKANATAGTANQADLSVGTNTVVGRVAGNIVAAQLVNDQIANATINPTTKLSSTGTPSATTYLRGDNTWATIAGGGDVTGPASSTDNFVALYNGATGKIIKNSTIDGAWFDQAVAQASSPTFVNPDVTGYTNYNAIAVPATPASGDVRLSARTEVNRTCLRMLCDEGIDADIQSAFYHRSIMLMGVTNGTTNPTTVNCNGQFTATLSYQHTIASANKWLATRRKRHATSTVAGNQSGWRINYGCCYRGNAAGYGGFYYLQRFGHNINLNGSQYFAGLAELTTALPATAGAVSALVNMIGVGYDTTDSSAGNWQFFRNDGSGTAVKVDLGASALRSDVSHGYELIIFLLPNSGTFYVKITNIHSGTVLLDTSYTTDVPAVNIGLCPRVEVNNGAVAAAANCEYSLMYLATNF